MANIEGEALKRIAGATKGGGISALTGWLTARGSKDSRGGGSSSKTAADWHNEEVAKRYEFGRQGERRQWAHEDTSNARFKDVSYGAEGGVRAGFYPASSGGQGTSGNKKGAQFADKTAAPKKRAATSKPSRENKIPSVASMTPDVSKSSAVDVAVSSTKKPRAPRSPKA